jgi:hypothetical protein
VDGVTHYFVGVRDGFGPRGGQAYTPTEGTFTYQLAKFGNELGIVLTAKDSALREKEEPELLKVGKTLLSKIRGASPESPSTP